MGYWIDQAPTTNLAALCEFIGVGDAGSVCRQPARHFWMNTVLPTVYAFCEEHNGRMTPFIPVWHDYEQLLSGAVIKISREEFIAYKIMDS
jgi:hypothetical protein